MWKYILFGLIFWGSWIVSLQYYGETKLHRYFIPVPEILLILSISYAVMFIHNKLKYLIRFILGVIIFIYFSQCVYYSQSGEFISILALENIDQAYLLISPTYIFLLSIILFIIYLIVKERSVSTYKRPNKYILSACIFGLFFIVTLQNIHISPSNLIGEKIRKIGGYASLFAVN